MPSLANHISRLYHPDTNMYQRPYHKNSLRTLLCVNLVPPIVFLYPLYSSVLKHVPKDLPILENFPLALFSFSSHTEFRYFERLLADTRPMEAARELARKEEAEDGTDGMETALPCSVPVNEIGDVVVGRHRNVAMIEYDMLYGSVMEELKDPRLSQLRDLQRRRREYRSQKDLKEFRKVMEETRLFFQKLSNSQVQARSFQIIKAHVELLRPFGTVIGCNTDAIFFIALPRHIPFLRENSYFCSGVSPPHRAQMLFQAEWMLICDENKYLLRKRDESDTWKAKGYNNMDEIDADSALMDAWVKTQSQENV